MTLPDVVTRDEWLAARARLLDLEKAATRARDALNAERRRLPMVRVDTDYRFTGPDGPASLADLFAGRRQLLVYHFMFAPDWTAGCRGCSRLVDSFGHQAHLNARDTTLVLVSRAPLPTLEAFRRRMGWTLPWFSSHGSDFNYDFHVTLDAGVTPPVYNYRAVDTTGEGHGVSAFLRTEAGICHTYSTYARGTDALNGTSALLDLTALGRQEHWEQPPGRSDSPAGGWWRLHDEY